MTPRSLSTRFFGSYRRRMANWFGRRPFELRLTRPLITFTFDDFPRSSLIAGGSILEQMGFRATYYVAMGLESQSIATGQMFGADDANQLLERGHELGCHTFDHHPAWETPTADYIGSVNRNNVALSKLSHRIEAVTHSYPISYPRPRTKRQVSRYFRGCRGGGQTFNQETIDLNYLKSFFLEQSRDDFGEVERMIAANARASGWLIFSTHDISDNPTRFGCRPTFLERVVRASANSDARLLVMSAGLDAIGA